VGRYSDSNPLPGAIAPRWKFAVHSTRPNQYTIAASIQFYHGGFQMKTSSLLFLALYFLNGILIAHAGDAEAVTAPTTDLVGVRVDRVIIDTDGLANASKTLAGSVDRLAQAIEQLSVENTNLDEEQKLALMRAVGSVDEASQALTSLAQQLPQSTRELGERLPGIIDATREPIDLLNRGLESARDSMLLLSDALPEATDNAIQLVNATLDAALVRLSIYTFVLLAAVALALIAIVWFLYWQYLGPLARKLDELVGAPEHFDNMSRHMVQTSDNLLNLQRRATRGVERLRRT
jgi:hypothetical protein